MGASEVYLPIRSYSPTHSTADVCHSCYCSFGHLCCCCASCCPRCLEQDCHHRRRCSCHRYRPTDNFCSCAPSRCSAGCTRLAQGCPSAHDACRCPSRGYWTDLCHAGSVLRARTVLCAANVLCRTMHRCRWIDPASLKGPCRTIASVRSPFPYLAAQRSLCCRAGLSPLALSESWAYPPSPLMTHHRRNFSFACDRGCGRDCCFEPDLAVDPCCLYPYPYPYPSYSK